jgi:hypothetical protein
MGHSVSKKAPQAYPAIRGKFGDIGTASLYQMLLWTNHSGQLRAVCRSFLFMHEVKQKAHDGPAEPIQFPLRPPPQLSLAVDALSKGDLKPNTVPIQD